MNVRLTKRASADVLARAAWLVERDLAAAETFRVELEATLAFLCERPSAGRKTRIGGVPGGVRRWPLPPMVIYFTRRGDELIVYRVRHASRRPIER